MKTLSSLVILVAFMLINGCTPVDSVLNEDSTLLPDLVITNVYQDGPYLRADYINNGTTAIDSFTFHWINNTSGDVFESSSLYPYAVPDSGVEKSTGGLTLGLIGIEPNKEYDVTLYIDSDNKVDEKNENNNSFSKKIFIEDFRPLPDLVITDIYQDGPYLRAEYINNGTTAIDSFTFHWINNTSGNVFESSSLFLYSVPDSGIVKITNGIVFETIGMEYDEEYDVTLQVDWQNKVEEKDEKNNSFSKKIFIDYSTQLPDLVVTDIYQDGPYLRADYINNGKSAIDSFTISWTNNTNGEVFETSSLYPYSVPNSGIEKTTGGLTLGLIGIEPNGEYDITVALDWQNKVDELNENNNSFSKKLIINNF